MAYQNRETEQEFSQGLGKAKQSAGTMKDSAEQVIDTVKNPQKIGDNIQRAKKGIEYSKKAAEIAKKAAQAAGKAAREIAASVMKFLLANPYILAALIIVVILVLIVVLIFYLPFGMNDKAQMHEEIKELRHEKHPTEEQAYRIGLEKVVPYTLKGISDAFDETCEKAEEKLDDYVKENFEEIEYPFIEKVVLTETKEEIAEYITPYIQAVHGALQYHVENHGFSVHRTLSPTMKSLLYIAEKNEYNTIDEEHYSKAVAEYAKEYMFFITEEIYEDLELSEEEFDVLDEYGNQVYDQFGNPEKYTEEVHKGTIYIGIYYYIGDYKTETMDEAAEYLAKEYGEENYEDSLMTEDLAREGLEESKRDYLLMFTGSREFDTYGGYMDGMLTPIVHIRKGEDPYPWADNPVDLKPGSISELLALGSHDIQADWALLKMLEQAQSSGYLTMKSRTREGYPYCTEWTHFFLYLAYGRDWNTNPWPGTDNGDGNGANIAYTLAMRYPNDWYTPSNGLPTAGAVFSIKGVNHVGIITRVEGDYIWYCDGNVGNPPHGYQTRINVKVSLWDFTHRPDGGLVYFANHR